MARKLVAGERITVDQVVKFSAQSEPYAKGLARVEPGQIGVVVSAAPQGRSTIVEFNGVLATISNQRLARTEQKPPGKKRGRKRKAESTPQIAVSPKQTRKSKSATVTSTTLSNETSGQLITAIANTLLLNGGLKNDGDAVVQIRFAELPENVRSQIRALIAAKLALS